MKKIIIVFIIILAAIFAVLTFMGKEGGHDAEKELWNIAQEFNKIAADPEATPDNAYDALEERYEQFIKKYSKAEIAPQAYLTYARLKVLRKDYTEAKRLYEELIAKYPDNKAASLDALLEIGKIQTIEKDDLGVLDTYQRVIRDYPTTEIGLRTPLLVAQYYLDRKQNNLVEKSFKEAAAHYEKLAEKEKGKPSGFYALQYLTVCYIAQQNWDKALETYEASLLGYADLNVWTPESLLKLVRALNTISATQKKSLDYPINLYSKFIEEKPEHPFTPILQKVIETLKQLKAKGAISPDTTVESLKQAVEDAANEAAAEVVPQTTE